MRGRKRGREVDEIGGRRGWRWVGGMEEKERGGRKRGREMRTNTFHFQPYMYICTSHILQTEQHEPEE